MGLVSKKVSTVNFFLISFFVAFNASAQEQKELAIGELTPEKAIELLLAEPLDEAVTYTKDDRGAVCEYRSKSLRYLVRYCDAPKKGRIAGTIIHTSTRQAVEYFIQLRQEVDFDFKEEYQPQQFVLRIFKLFYPYSDYNPDIKQDPPVCEAGFFVPPPNDPTKTIFQNISNCKREAADYQEKWRASGVKLRDEPNNKLLVDLTNLHISKYSTPPPKK